VKTTPVTDPASFRGPESTRRGWALAIIGLAAFTLVAFVCVVESYVSFKYPIKQDRYRHHFFEHVLDRAAAYALLLRSSLRWHNAGMPVESIQQIVRDASEAYGVDACLVAAVVTFESGFNPNTVTTTGAMGLMALQPATARVLGVRDPFDPRQNVDGGTRMLQELLTAFNGDARLALAGYNAGPNAVRRYDGVPPFRETEDYVSHVGTIYDLCRARPTSFFTARDERPSR
jgi:soluble lytic murein transglycosylase-like protein